MGVHYMNGAPGPRELNADGVVDDEDLRHPLMLIFTGTDPTARVAGLVYWSASTTEPAGFHGRNDGWHYHENLCLSQTPQGVDFPFGSDNAATEQQCGAEGGNILPTSPYMVHVWSVPGFDVPDDLGGMFASANPKLMCSDGTYYKMPVEEWGDHLTNICAANL
jgi:hypothetical protein